MFKDLDVGHLIRSKWGPSGIEHQSTNYLFLPTDTYFVIFSKGQEKAEQLFLESYKNIKILYHGKAINRCHPTYYGEPSDVSVADDGNSFEYMKAVYPHAKFDLRNSLYIFEVDE